MVYVNTCGVPAQLKALVGVTVTVATMLVVKVFSAVKEGIEFPVPFESPMFTFAGEIVQAKVVPGKFDVNGTANVEVLAQSV